MRYVSIAFCLSLSLSAFAAVTEFDHLQIDNNACALVHSGSRNKDVVWLGETTIGMCNIDVPATEFSEKYTMCALSGVLGAENGQIMCEFGFADKLKERVYFMSAGGTSCQFVCLRQD